MKRSCRILASKYAIFDEVLAKYGLPPMWEREPGFATLLYIILEQQVSLASAKACFDKLALRLGSVTPKLLLTLDDAELKAVGFSRQKAAYARHLSEAILENRLDLTAVAGLPDTQAKSELTRLKGVGDWTSDIYLLMALLRSDIMPRGDIALHEAFRRLSGAETRPATDEFVEIAKEWSPHRSSAARLLWHFYLSERRPKAEKAA